jgi:hypothetical protein
MTPRMSGMPSPRLRPSMVPLFVAPDEELLVSEGMAVATTTGEPPVAVSNPVLEVLTTAFTNDDDDEDEDEDDVDDTDDDADDGKLDDGPAADADVGFPVVAAVCASDTLPTSRSTNITLVGYCIFVSPLSTLVDASIP